MTGRITGKSFGASTLMLITGAALLCTLSSAQLSLAAQQVLTQPNAIRQTLAKGTQQTPSSALASQAPAKSASKPVAATDTKPGVKPAAAHENISRRDPFNPLVGGPVSGGGLPEHLPPGKAGLVISMLRLDGIVKGPGGMIAVVTNGQQRVYFLREGDHLYDGSVEHITMTDISFHETGKDPFGKPVEHEVSKPLNATPGEQQ